MNFGGGIGGVVAFVGRLGKEGRFGKTIPSIERERERAYGVFEAVKLKQRGRVYGGLEREVEES